MKIETKQQRHANSEGGHLRHRDVHENDATLHDVETEINEQPRQEDTGHDRPEHYLPHIRKRES